MSKFDEYEEDYEDEEEEKGGNTTIWFLDLVSTWFIRIGIVLAAIALIYFVVTGQFFSAFMYIIGLVVAYYFGYFFMFCLDRFLSAD